jgi:membrane protease YdiL (CAAX protease family)
LRIVLLAQPAILVCVGALLGVLLADGVGLRSHIVAYVRGVAASSPEPESTLLAVAIGLAVGWAIVAVDLLCKLAAAPRFRDDLAAAHVATERPGLAGRVSAVLYGGIAEEIMMRFGVMTLLVWIGAALAPGPSAEQSEAIVWSAIILSALLFGIGHLPKAASLGALDAAGVVRIVALNGIAGVAYGWLYWRAGLEHAMLAHMATHAAFWTAGPLLAWLAVRLVSSSDASAEPHG